MTFSLIASLQDYELLLVLVEIECDIINMLEVSLPCNFNLKDGADTKVETVQNFE